MTKEEIALAALREIVAAPSAHQMKEIAKKALADIDALSKVHHLSAESITVTLPNGGL